MLAVHCNLTKKTIHKYSTSPCMVQVLATSLLVCLISVREAAERISGKKNSVENLLTGITCKRFHKAEQSTLKINHSI